ncbi:hypothetical protein EPO33_03850 [Patescibacteria group bacterium]|nr:MAG: hypothetical protein EPO33_03850 [Patescibacteria group bacterium]
METEKPPVTRRGFMGAVFGWIGAVVAARILPGCATRYEAVGPELVASGGETVLELTHTAYPGAYDVHTVEVRGAILVRGIRGYDEGAYQYMVDGDVIGDGDRPDPANTFAVDRFRLWRGARLQWVRVVA